MRPERGEIPWPKVRLGEVLRREARPVEVVADQTYREIGIRSHGKGIFHKEPVSGLSLGDKRVFWLKPGDFVLNIVFAWEGAVAVIGESEAGMIGSHRFPTFRADEARLYLRFLVAYFRTPPGLDLLGRVSPGGAGRNRTLSQTAFLDQQIPLPPLAEQQRVVARIEEVAAQIHEARSLRTQAADEADALHLSVLLSTSLPVAHRGHRCRWRKPSRSTTSRSIRRCQNTRNYPTSAAKIWKARRADCCRGEPRKLMA